MTKAATEKKSKIKTGPYDSLRDYMDAIELNASYIRIGTALFGERKK